MGSKSDHLETFTARMGSKSDHLETFAKMAGVSGFLPSAFYRKDRTNDDG